MNSYPDIIAAGDKLLRKDNLTEETRQVAALVVALAHRIQKDLEGGEAGDAPSGTLPPPAPRAK